MTKYECDYQDNIVCPYCGDEIVDDCWDYFNDDEYNHTTIECQACEKKFSCGRQVSFNYSTSKIPCKNGEPHQFAWNHRWEDKEISYCEWCNKIQVVKVEDDVKS